jgi:hypothetical protein
VPSAWSYSGDPRSTDRDWVRFKIGDTDAADQLLFDGEIEALIADAGSKQLAAVLACDAIVAKFARDADFTNMHLQVARSQRVDQYRQLGTTLRLQLNGSLLPSNPSEDVAWKEARNNEQGTYVQPMFKRGQDDNPRGVGNNSQDSGASEDL